MKRAVPEKPSEDRFSLRYGPLKEQEPHGGFAKSITLSQTDNSYDKRLLG